MIEKATSFHVQGGALAPCCAHPENRGPAIPQAPGLIYRRCRVCSRRHFEATAEPVRLGLGLARLG